MTMHWTERRRAVVVIGHALRQRGWALLGYHADASDIASDYFSPASWDGIAVHPDHPGVVVGAAVTGYDVRTHSGKDDWPTFQETPKGRAWHVEYRGSIVASGTGLGACADYHPDLLKVAEVTDAILAAVERAAHDSVAAAEPDPTTAGTAEISYDRDWTWVKFPAKPPDAVRAALMHLGFSFGGRRQAWFAKRRVSTEELAPVLAAA